MILTGLLFVALVLLSTMPVWAGPAEAATTVVDQWVAAFVANDGPGVVKLYAPDAN